MRVGMTEVYRDWINSLRDRVGRARAGVLIILLAGGDKSSQQQDIKAAISLVSGLKE